MNTAMLDGAEKKLQRWYKGAPNLSKKFRVWIAKYAWLFVLLGALVTVFAGKYLLAAMGIIAAPVGAPEMPDYGFFGWIALAMMTMYLIFSIIAVPPLKAQKEEGWRILFYLQFLSLAFALTIWLAQPERVVDLLVGILSVAIGLYLLFQIKNYFQ